MASDKVYFDAHILSTLPSGRTYSHIHIKPTENEPYLLFLDGFPGTSYLGDTRLPNSQLRAMAL